MRTPSRAGPARGWLTEWRCSPAASTPRCSRRSIRRSLVRSPTPHDSTEESILKPPSIAFLKSLLDTHAPSGYEAAAAKVWRAEASTFAAEVAADVHGNS